MKDTDAVNLATAELTHARDNNAPFNSAHEGYAVILEELDELWAEVKKNTFEKDQVKVQAEAVQLAAMALRFLVDCC